MGVYQGFFCIKTLYFNQRNLVLVTTSAYLMGSFFVENLRAFIQA